MPDQQQMLAILRGDAQGVGPTLLRGGLRAVEPLYAGITSIRNKLFDLGAKKAHRLGRPTVSVGNITTGGTGKTPVVQWIARTLIARGHRPAVLLRGYKAHAGQSDEAALYRQIAGLDVEPDPNRIAAAARVLARSPQTSVFLLDDAFQHRRAARDLDIVLIDATNPFGFGHVLPRGLLREPPSGLARADVLIITRADDRADTLRQQLRTLNPRAPILASRHVIRGLIDDCGQPVRPPARAIAAAGIGNPDAFFEQLRQRLGVTLTQTIALADHEPYTEPTLARLRTAAGELPVIVTEKDFVKLVRTDHRLQLLRATLDIDFADGDADILLRAIDDAVTPPALSDKAQ